MTHRLAAPLNHPSIQASVASGLVLLAASVVTTMPWWLVATWAGLSIVAASQALRQPA